MEEFLGAIGDQKFHKFNLPDKLVKRILLLKKEKNISLNTSDSDKNTGLVVAEPSKNKEECQRQLGDTNTYLKLSKEELFIKKEAFIVTLESLIEKYGEICTEQEKRFLKTNLKNHTLPHFYILWKINKNPIVGRPVVIGYNWIPTCASIFEFCRETFLQIFGIAMGTLVHQLWQIFIGNFGSKA